jgi:hypothetical protein
VLFREETWHTPAGDSRFPPFRNLRGKMGHPFVWLGVGDAKSLGFARDDRFFSRPHAGFTAYLSGWKPLDSSLLRHG